ncbi:hypothetical protein KBB96_09880 [Luteolibacter ambystomatis]|uniref:Uncharacterized protein n=1 Tax=Luteolibacter ambystomatis TaxID=2824561 RepID=A0A975J352_9BACT|nr:hypothetical protein [Luteolibacter ambystomatis]QUE53190.1 hypothetical protein KBB96_09880 [Luteolibacter ambystomatis]
MNADYHYVRVLLHEADDANSQVEKFSDAMRAVGAIDVMEGGNSVTTA